jgi:DNA-binding NarL/FixJ family response regulator
LIIIKLAEQGLTDKEIADELCMSYGGIKNIITKLFKKLHVNSMLQAVNVVINNLMLFNPVVKRNTYKATPKKRNYHPLTAERIVNIQQRLDNGQSISSIAKKEKTSRTNIYNAINSGKLIFEKKT